MLRKYILSSCAVWLVTRNHGLCAPPLRPPNLVFPIRGAPLEHDAFDGQPLAGRGARSMESTRQPAVWSSASNRQFALE